jgi:DNA repair exonuclease SbcCD nuclease subunit
MEELNIIITDTHFGVKSNSVKWLTHQIYGLDEIKEYIITNKPKYDIVNIIHCGDVFDNRSSINTMILKNIREKLYELADLVDVFYIIAGNHDYYSPKEDFKEINSLDLLLQHPKIVLITNKYLMSKNQPIRKCFVPWYEFDRMNDIIENESPDIIFTHGDLYEFKNIYNANIISGHIHVPVSYGNAKNIGSLFAMNFADANQERGFYTYEKNELNFHPLKNIIKFYNLNANDDSFFTSLNYNVEDYIRIYIDSDKAILDSYNDIIKQYREICNNVDLFISNKSIESLSINTDINDINIIIDSLIPEHLKTIFSKLK